MVEEWIDVTAMNSEYEQETSYCGKWRHRPLIKKLEKDHKWTEGAAPDLHTGSTKYATKYFHDLEDKFFN